MQAEHQSISRSSHGDSKGQLIGPDLMIGIGRCAGRILVVPTHVHEL